MDAQAALVALAVLGGVMVAQVAPDVHHVCQSMDSVRLVRGVHSAIIARTGAARPALRAHPALVDLMFDQVNLLSVPSRNIEYITSFFKAAFNIKQY